MLGHICAGVLIHADGGEKEKLNFILMGDNEYPTFAGTGTEDYFGGAYNFENTQTRQYQEFSTPYAGMPQVIRPLTDFYQSRCGSVCIDGILLTLFISGMILRLIFKR